MVDLTNEHEMLEMAAKAAGFKKYYEQRHLGRNSFVTYDAEYYSDIKGCRVVGEKTLDWNPLVNYSDAFELMVKLDIQVYRHPKLGGIIVCADSWSWDDHKHYHAEVKINKEDVAFSFCYAIVKVAAEIGRNM